MSIEISFPFPLLRRLWATLCLVPSRWSSIVFQIVIPLVSLAFLAALLYGLLPARYDRWSIVAIVGAVFPLFPLLGVTISYLSNPAVREPFVYELDEVGVHVRAKSIEYTQRWPTISTVKLRGGFLMLFFRPGCAHCLPVKELHAAGKFTQIVDLLRSVGKRVDVPG